MKNLFKGKLATAGIIIATLVLAGVAIFTAIRLYQLRKEAVAPTAPTSKPKAQEVPRACTTLAFTLTTSTPTATPTGSPTATPTTTPTSTPGEPNSCNGTCGSNYNCRSEYFCYQGYCRNASCPSDQDCVCSGTSTPAPTSTPRLTTSTPTPTQAALPDAGTSLPTIFGITLGSLLLLGAIFLAL